MASSKVLLLVLVLVLVLVLDPQNVPGAAYIEPWATNQNDDPENGLTVSKNAHWMFDGGLWSVDDDFRVVVAPHRFVESGPEVLRLASYAGRHLQFDPRAKMRPSTEMFRRHRHRHGFALS